jgi:WD40 repeat protein
VGDIAQSAAFSPDGHRLAVGSEGGGIWLFDLSSPDPMASPVVSPVHRGPVNVVAFSPDNRWLATGSVDASALLFDLGRGQTAKPFALRGPGSSIRSMTISWDSRWLVAGSDDGRSYLWDLTAEQPALAPLVFDARPVPNNGSVLIERVAFNRAQRALLTVSHGNVRLWPLSLARLEEMARLTVGRNLTREEWDQYFPGEPYRPTFASLPVPPPQPTAR